MANNRVYLWCPKCREAWYLAKTYDDGNYFLSTGSEREEAILGENFLNFFQRHYWCSEIASAGHVELRFEWHPDKDRQVPLDVISSCGRLVGEQEAS